MKSILGPRCSVFNHIPCSSSQFLRCFALPQIPPQLDCHVCNIRYHLCRLGDYSHSACSLKGRGGSIQSSGGVCSSIERDRTNDGSDRIGCFERGLQRTLDKFEPFRSFGLGLLGIGIKQNGNDSAGFFTGYFYF